MGDSEPESGDESNQLHIDWKEEELNELLDEFIAEDHSNMNLYDFGDLDDPDDDAEDDSKESEASHHVASITPEPLTVKEQEKLPLYKSASSSRAKSPVYAQRHTRRSWNRKFTTHLDEEPESPQPTVPVATTVPIEKIEAPVKKRKNEKTKTKEKAKVEKVKVKPEKKEKEKKKTKKTKPKAK